MAIIGKIRERLGVLLAVIIGLALFGFLLTSALNDNLNLLGSRSTVIAKIDGNKIEANDYFAKVDEYLTVYSLFNNGRTADEATAQSFREQVWTDMINNALLELKYRKYGIAITNEEMVDQCMGPNPHPVIRQYFGNQQTGQFDPNTIIEWKKKAYKENPEEQVKWKFLEDMIRKDRLKTKLLTIYRKSVYVPKWQKELEYHQRNDKADVNYVMVPYQSISDDKVKPTDEELNKYLSEHSANYQNIDETRKLEYVVFDMKASKEDSDRVRKQFTSLLPMFRSSTNDSAFVYANSEEPLNTGFVKRENMNLLIADSAFGKPVKSVFGPYIDNGMMKIAKIYAAKNVPDSVRARHILITAQGDTSAANRRIDSIMKAIKGGADFAAMAMKYSTDPGSKVKGGDLGYFTEGKMVPEFNDACFGGSTGSLVKVRTQYGVHLIQVTDQKGGKPAVKLFVVAKSLKPSQSTEKAVYAMANQFAATNSTAALFDTAATKMNLMKRVAEPIRENDRSIPGFPSARDVVKWAYQAEIGNISGTYRLDDKLIVAKLVSINKIGTASLDQVRSEITQEVIREKKAAMIIKDMQSKIAGKADLASIAQAIGDTIHHAMDANIYNPFIPGFGPEFAMMGTALSGKYASKPSAPIKGTQAVFIVQTGALKAAPATTDYSSIDISVKMQATSNLEQLLPAALKRQFTVTDNRSKFF